MSVRERLTALLGGVLAGMAGGFFGVGGGLVLVPVLTAVFRLSQHQAHGTSLAVIGVTALVSLMVYGAFANVAWISAVVIAAGSLFTARYGARLASQTSPRRLAKAFAVFLALVAVRLLWRAPAGNIAPLDLGAWHPLLDLALGGAAGMLAGFMGVGGGILVVPGLTLLVGMPQQLAQGTSLAMILVAAPAGAIEHARHGNVVGRWIPTLAVGAALGGPLASWWVQGLPPASLARAFAVFLLVNAVHTWIRADRRVASAASRGSSAQSA